MIERTVLASALVLCFGLSIPSVAMAGGLGKKIEKVSNVASKVGKAVNAVSGAGKDDEGDDAAEPGESASSGSSDKDADDPAKSVKVVKQVFDDAKKACSKLAKERSAGSVVSCIKSVDVKDLKAAMKGLRDGWNGKIANNGRLTVGPREIELGGEQTGALYGHMGRRFVTVQPLMDDKLTIEVVKRAGKSAGRAEACLQDEDGKTACKSVDFEKGKGTATKTISLENAAGKVLTVRVEGNGAITRKFGYAVKVKS